MTVASHLKSLQALDLALRTGSVKGAADLLGITPAAAGQRIKVLEDYLGFELLTRGRSGLRPTPALADAVAPLAAAFEQLKSSSNGWTSSAPTRSTLQPTATSSSCG